MTAANTARAVNDVNMLDASVMGHKTISSDVVSLEASTVASDMLSDAVENARAPCALGSAPDAPPLPKGYCGRSIAGNHSLRGLNS